MSLDSGVYILHTTSSNGSEYRVAHAFAIENVWNEKTGMASLIAVFGDSPPLNEFIQAADIADAIDTADQTEHGVLLITDFNHLTYDEIKQEAERQSAMHSQHS